MRTIKCGGLLLFLSLLLASCDTNPVGEEEGSPLPSELSIEDPSDQEIYWDDFPVPCKANVGIGNSTPVTWQVDGNEVDCVAGSLDYSFEKGSYTITAVAGQGDESIKESVVIEVDTGFQVSIVEPSEQIFFTEEAVSCEAEVKPERPVDEITWYIDGQQVNCQEFKAEDPGEFTLSVKARVADRVESSNIDLEVLPTIAGSIAAITDETPEKPAAIPENSGIRAYLRINGSVVSTEVSDSKFAIKDKIAGDIRSSTEVEIFVSGNNSLYPSYVKLDGDELLELIDRDSLSFLLSPKSWRIRTGRHRGKTTDIRLVDAFESDGSGGFDFFWTNASILKDDRPLPLAFANSSKSDKDIVGDYADGFWEQIRLLEDYLGMGELFTPADEGEVPTVRDGVLVWIDSDLGTSKAGPSTDNGNIIGGRIKFDRMSMVDSDYTVMHESIHVLGFGHTSKWPSIMGAKNDPTPIDVSHIQLTYTARDLQNYEGYAFGIEEAYQGEKRENEF